MNEDLPWNQLRRLRDSKICLHAHVPGIVLSAHIFLASGLFRVSFNVERGGRRFSSGARYLLESAGDLGPVCLWFR